MGRAGPAGLGRFSIGLGDRFGREGEAQLAAVIEAGRRGIALTPVWNKSYREHRLIGTVPADVRREADAAVRSLGWTRPYFVDADHVSLQTVDYFIVDSDFFTLDVADAIGRPSDPAAIDRFCSSSGLEGSHTLAGGASLSVTAREIRDAAVRFLSAIDEARRIYARINASRQGRPFAVEVSMDETETPQSAAELLCILRMITDAGIPVDTIAPRFCGRFNKGVDYSGDPVKFETEFDSLLAVLAYGREKFGLKSSLKFSMHSGSDKFSVYPAMRRSLAARGEGLHLKTAGTTWLEEVAGLAEAGGTGLDFVKRLYASALERLDEMIGPYAGVVEIDRGSLPRGPEFASWTSEKILSNLVHEPGGTVNRSFRQVLHVSFRIAAERAGEFAELTAEHRSAIAKRVTDNLLRKHILPLFTPDSRT